MKTEAKKDLIERLEIELDRQINLVVFKFQNLSDEQLNKAGAKGGWSIAQNLEHLNLYFDYYIPAIEDALNKAKEDSGSRVFRSGWLGGYFTNSMDYKKGGKMKAFKDYVPDSTLNSTEVIQKFIQNEEVFLQLLRRAGMYNMSKVRLPISLTKWITMRLGDVFQFVLKHNERHLVQAEVRLEEWKEQFVK